MVLEYRKGIQHSNADILSRPRCGVYVQCQMSHEDAKKGKIKTRILNIIEKVKEEQLNISEEINLSKTEIPDDKIHETIEEVHKLLCHAGDEKVYEYMRNKYIAKNLWSQIHKIVRSCGICQKNKVVTTATREKTKRLEATNFFEVIFTDICGPMRETGGRNKYILGIIDKYSKCMVLIALPRQDEETIRKAIFKKWILRFRCPREIRFDCGKGFESRVMREFALKLYIKLCFSSPYHHNANGQIERQFRKIRDLNYATLQERKKTN